MAKAKHWYDGRIPEGKFIAPPDYQHMDVRILHELGFVLPEEIALTKFDLQLGGCLEKILDVPFNTLKPIIYKAVDKYFPTQAEFEKCCERDFVNENLTEENVFVKLLEESFNGHVDREMAYEVLKSVAALNRAYDEYRDAELTANRYDDFSSCGYGGYDTDGADAAADEAWKIYDKQYESHKALVKEFTRDVCPELMPEATDEISW